MVRRTFLRFIPFFIRTAQWPYSDFRSSASISSTVLLFAAGALHAEQSEGQLGSGDDDVLTVSDTSTESYLETVSKADNTASHPFRPTASDLLIQQAEEKLHVGRDFYRQHDSHQARAVLNRGNRADAQGVRQSVRTAFCIMKRGWKRWWISHIHRLDMAGLGAAVSSLRHSSV